MHQRVLSQTTVKKVVLDPHFGILLVNIKDHLTKSMCQSILLTCCPGIGAGQLEQCLDDKYKALDFLNQRGKFCDYDLQTISAFRKIILQLGCSSLSKEKKAYFEVWNLIMKWQIQNKLICTDDVSNEILQIAAAEEIDRKTLVENGDYNLNSLMEMTTEQILSVIESCTKVLRSRNTV